MKDSRKKPTQGDMVFENAVLFLRDALISRLFTDAVKSGDSGVVVLVLKAWALGFRGNGRTKYAHEMLHIIHHLTNILTPEIRAIILNNWLLNPTGNPNSWVEVDLVQEHLNFWIKSFYRAHGSNASWDWLKAVSPCVDALRQLARNFHAMLGADQGTRHAPADLSKDIDSLMTFMSEHKVYEVQKGRTLDEDETPAKDVIAVGFHNLTTGSKNPLAEYNEAFERLQRRCRMKPVTARDGMNVEANVGQSKEGETLTGQRPSDEDHPKTTNNDTTDPGQILESEDNPFVPESLTFEIVEDESETISELERILEDVEGGKGEVEVMFPVLNEDDVSLDMDTIGEEIESDDESLYASDEE
ncbi:hypothetical protein D9613_007562 [Agrocybe pediades]|uniref:DUF6589 domain-containing protein n=1 Tax=Agrocybe pediades TaxID=84607 RepID=A0A8H4QME7_9AGAR|nr:hypothetical protein D9613_007562 [Agrocybe pediades]